MIGDLDVIVLSLAQSRIIPDVESLLMKTVDNRIDFTPVGVLIADENIWLFVVGLEGCICNMGLILHDNHLIIRI